MKLITTAGRVASVLDRWREQYGVGNDARKDAIYHAIARLKNPTADQIDAIIGNDTWTRSCCTECGARGHISVVEVGEEPDYESQTAWLCRECLGRCIDLFA